MRVNESENCPSYFRGIKILASVIVFPFARKHQCMECDACLFNCVKFVQNSKEKFLIDKEIFALLK